MDGPKRRKLSEAECRKKEQQQQQQQAGDSHRRIPDHSHSHRPPSPPILHSFLQLQTLTKPALLPDSGRALRRSQEVGFGPGCCCYCCYSADKHSIVLLGTVEWSDGAAVAMRRQAEWQHSVGHRQFAAIQKHNTKREALKMVHTKTFHPNLYPGLRFISFVKSI